MTNRLPAHTTSDDHLVRDIRGHNSSTPLVIRDRASEVGQIVGTNPQLLDAIRQAELVAPLNSTVLLLGETGTGKELLARLFLDEIGDLPLKAQAKLLRVLQDGHVQRIGSVHTAPVDVRVITATNQDLGTAIRQKHFRTDLFYRISTFPIRLPPLRDRLTDVPLLARHFVCTIGIALRKDPIEFEKDALDHLTSRAWPGNIRELHNVIERAVILAAGPRIGLDLVMAGNGFHLPTADPDKAIPLADAERQAILTALAVASWRISGRRGAAELLQVKATTLHAKMRKLGIRRPPKLRCSLTTPP
jgi:formate hydrogenlyase transcriptional activator